MSMSSPGEDGRHAPAGCEDAAVWWPRRRSMWFDFALAAFAAVEGGWDAVKFTQQHGHERAVAVLVAAALLGAATGATLLVRRRWPLVPVVVALASMPVQVGYMQLVIGLYSIGVYRPTEHTRWGLRRMMTGISAVVMAESIAISYWQLGFLEAHSALRHPLPAYARLLFAVLLGIGLTLPPVVIGLYVGARRRLMESLRERAEGLETELALLAGQAQERARRAQVEERTRIAREMHDVVAHRVSLMVVHAGALERVAPKDPEKAVESARLMGEIGRQALTELRQILGVLRTVEPSPDAAESLGLAPRLADISRVVDESRAAGLPVRLTFGGARRTLSLEAEQTAYRVVQEALTNVLKHAPGAETEVVVAYVPNGVALAVSNACPGGAPARAEGDRAPLPSGGNGLVGMRERVTALGGAFEAGPTADGGFRVEARLLAAPVRV